MDHFNPGVTMKGKRNPNYFRDIWFDEIEMLAIGDVVARQNALNSGDVHYITAPTSRPSGCSSAIPM